MNLGENIYHLRTGRNLSQGDLADALDVSRQSVSKWENNSATPELEKLIKINGKTATVVGVEELYGATVFAHDLRAGAALVIAGLSAQGTTQVEDIHYVERGYEDLIGKLTALGADIRRVED